MKTVILSVAFVLGTFTAKSQTFDNPVLVRTFAQSEFMEWTYMETSPEYMIMLGRAEDLNKYVSVLINELGLEDVEMKRGKKVWEFIYKDGSTINMTLSIRKDHGSIVAQRIK